MAATVIPGQPKRWGNESTNFYHASYTLTPGVATRQKIYRCSDSQYTNSGHYHVGTKSVNLNPPLDRYGSASAYKLRTVDQTVPKAMTTSAIQASLFSRDKPVNLYSSHEQRYHSYAMARPPVKRTSHETLGGNEALARSLNDAFYITSYQSDIARRAARTPMNYSDTAMLPESSSSTTSLCDNFNTRRNSISASDNTQFKQRRNRVSSAPPLRRTTTTPPIIPHPPTAEARLTLQRRRSFSAMRQSYPTRGEMIKDIFTAFPAPTPQAASKRASRPSSAVGIRTGKIPNLRQLSKNAWI